MIIIKRFWLNGQKYYTNQEATLYDLIEYFNYSQSLFVLEYNSSICNRSSWAKIFISDSDRIEMVSIVGGG